MSDSQVPASKKHGKKKGKNMKVTESGDHHPVSVTDGTDESKLNGTTVPEPQPSTSGTSKSASSSTSDPVKKTIEQLTAEQKKKEEELRKALEIMKLAQQAGLGPGALSSGVPLAAQPKTAEEAKKKKYEFWETQPVPQMHEEVPFHVEINEPIDPNTDVDKVRKEPLTLPEGFVWVSMDVDNDSDLNELFTLLFENYVEDDDNMFRFNYSHEFLRWVLKPPGYNTDWFCGVRVGPKPGQTKLGKLVGFVSAIPAKVRVYDQILRAVEINFLCVHKKLRAKRMAPVLIKEITRRVNLTGIWQALYTAGVFVPKPVSTCRYFHRSLNPKKLIEVGFSSLTKNMNMSRTVKLYRLPEQAQLEGLRQMDPAKDMPQVFQLITDHMGKFDLVPQFNLEELTHWLSPVPNVIDTYVVERPSNPDSKNSKKEIVAFFSFYILPSTVMNHKVHKDVKAAYSFYNVVATDKLNLTDLMNDALIVAKNSGMDVFNALNQMENDEFLTKLKFGSGDGSLHYYLFNWKCPPFKPAKIGVVLQ